MTEYFTIDSTKLQEVIAIVMPQRPGATEETIEGHILADWPEGAEHQEWLDCADAKEIADWVLDCTANGEMYTLLDSDVLIEDN